jgi:hypothetical protein
MQSTHLQQLRRGQTLFISGNVDDYRTPGLAMVPEDPNYCLVSRVNQDLHSLTNPFSAITSGLPTIRELSPGIGTPNGSLLGKAR